jgi:hypothetical protein
MWRGLPRLWYDLGIYIISAIIWVSIFVYVFETLTYSTSGVNGILRRSRSSLLRIANLDIETLCYLVMTYKKPKFRSTSLWCALNVFLGGLRLKNANCQACSRRSMQGPSVTRGSTLLPDHKKPLDRNVEATFSCVSYIFGEIHLTTRPPQWTSIRKIAKIERSQEVFVAGDLNSWRSPSPSI